MNIMSWLQFPLYVIVLLILVKPLGLFMARFTRVNGPFFPRCSRLLKNSCTSLQELTPTMK